MNEIPTKSKALCSGCTENFYNGQNPMGIKECWNYKSANVVKRYAIGTWTAPTAPFAFTECHVLNCRRGNGVHYYEKLPDFVKPGDVSK